MTTPVHLPIVPPAPATAAPSAGTKFIHARVNLRADCSLIVDGNSKITASNGTYAEPRPNALSLPAASVSGASSCPGSTAVCRSTCYVRGLAKHAPDVYAAYASNAETVERILREGPEWRTYSAFTFASWINANARGGFRWHVSGDVMSVAHAEWIVSVCMFTSSRVRHWIYTRTLGAVETLQRADNLAVNVSADEENYADAVRVARNTGARVCYMTNEAGYVPALPDGSVIFPNYPHRGRELADPTEHPWWQARTARERKMVCVADFFGQSENHRCGPCARCLIKSPVKL